MPDIATPAFTGAVKAGRHFTPEYSRDLLVRQYQPRTDGRIRRLDGPRFAPTARGMLRDLGHAARAGRLTGWEAEFIVSIQRQAARPRWRPSPRQDAVIRRLAAALAEAEVAIIDDDDTVDARRRVRRPGPEFVGLTARG